MSADAPGCAQLAELASQTGEGLGLRLHQGSWDTCGPGLTGPSRPPKGKGKGKLRDAALVFCVVVVFQGKV